MNMFRTLTAREIECRVQQIQEKGLVLLLYKDARCDQNILDETVGPMNWQRGHTRDNANCTVSIWDVEKKEWISKEDTGTESNTEAKKGLASDSFKRACVNWGIGRELYTAPFIWVSADKCKIEPKGNGLACYDKFDVSDIGYNEAREINRLAIVNTKTGQTVYMMNGQPAEQAAKFVCADCGKVLEPYKDDKGREVGVRYHAELSRKRFGTVRCIGCIRLEKAEALAARFGAEQ